MLTSEQLREKFIEYWTSDPINCKEVPNVSLVPNNDPTLLFVNSGMFPINPYLAGQPHPLGDRLCNIQRCLRTPYDEMLEIGDNRHTLMFEMMGDWSLGAYTKKEQIPWIMKFWVEICGLDPNRLYVSVFAGDDVVGRDDEAIETWKEAFKSYGIDAEFSEDISNLPKPWDQQDGISEEAKNWKYRIFPFGKKKNWWQRAADAPGELGGPTSEMFYDMGEIVQEEEVYNINDDSGRFIEIGNNVFMEYKFGEDHQWHELEKKNIDFGGGFERVLMITQNKSDIFETDVYEPILNKVAELSGKEYKSLGQENEYTAYFRILADHSRAATFIIADGVKPSNKDQGYILRRFIRRLVRFGLKLGIEDNFTKYLAEEVINKMNGGYAHLDDMKEVILEEIEKEEIKFRKTLNNGLREIQKLIEKGEKLNGELAFYVYETYGFPLELTLEEFGVDENEMEEIQDAFNEKNDAHRAQSRAGAEQKFKGGLADHSEEVTKLHTAHHLLLRALQIVLGDHVKQRGSNITGERLRIDFSHTEKLTPEQVEEVEKIVNEKIREELPVTRVELPKDEAESIGAEMEFGQKYPDMVSVYYIGDSLKAAFSKEFCGGPHVENTKVIGEGNKTFKIDKQESSGAGIRRIKAKLV